MFGIENITANILVILDMKYQLKLNHLFHKSMSPPKPITSRHGSNRCVLLTCKFCQMTFHIMRTDTGLCINAHISTHIHADPYNQKHKLQSKGPHWYQPSWIKSGYTKFAGDKWVSWNAARSTGELRLRRGRRLSGWYKPKAIIKEGIAITDNNAHTHQT